MANRRAISRDGLWVGAIVLLAIALRFVAIGSTLNVDDGYSWLVASAPTVHTFLGRLAGSENTPPLVYLLMAPLPLDHPAVLRLAAAIPGVLMCPIMYASLRRPLGSRTALIAALGVAVAPLLITYSDLARGFMLEDAALLVALWAVLRLGESRARARWWCVYAIAAVVALYSEYDSAVFLLALTLAALWTGAPQRRRMAILGPLPLLSLIPWIPQMVHAQNAVGKTKLSPTFPGPSLSALRNAVTTLALGEYGGTTRPLGRWLEFAIFIALAVTAFLVLRRSTRSGDTDRTRALIILAATAALTLIGHAIAGALGFDIFNQRYLTILIPLAAALAAAAVVAAGHRELTILAIAALTALGVVNLVRRGHGHWLPSLAPVRAAALRLHPRTTLTNNPTVLYYLRALRPQLDRPFNLGPGHAQSCTRPCLIVDDTTVYTGTPRRIAGTPEVVGRYALTLER